MSFQKFDEVVSRAAEAQKSRIGDKAELKAWRWSTNAALVDLFHELCGATDVQLFVECGAHSAEDSLRFLRGSPGRQAIAIEANPYVYEQRTRVAETLGVRTLNVGLGSEPGYFALQIPNKRGASEPIVPYASFLNHKDEQYWPSKTVRCEVKTLDSILTEPECSKTIALWIDVEGAAGDVLRGAEEILRSGRVKLLMVEVETKHLWKEQMVLSDIQEHLAPFGLNPVARDAQMGNTQFNVIFAQGLGVESMRLVEEFRNSDLFIADSLRESEAGSRLQRFFSRARSVTKRFPRSRYTSSAE
jgi:FkbM family methyltransferase